MVQYQCKRCKKTFKQRIDYTRHRQRKRKCEQFRAESAQISLNGAKKFLCNWCNKTYTSKGVLNRHISQSCQVLKASKLKGDFGAKSAPLEKHPIKSTVKYDVYSSQDSPEISEGEKKFTFREKNSPKGEKNSPSCIYCKKVIHAKKYLKHHYKTCKQKLKHDMEQIITEQKRRIMELEKIKEEKDELEKEYFEFMKEMAIKNNTNIVYNDNKRCVNMYFIMNNYTEAHNMEKLMSPEISQTETKMIKGSSVRAGVFNFIKHRCIDNVDLENRPFHCVDESRNKYLLYTGDTWKIDKNGDNIIGSAIDKIKGIYDTNITRGDSKRSMEKKLQNISDLLDLEKTGRKKIMKELNKMTLIKNTIKQVKEK